MVYFMKLRARIKYGNWPPPRGAIFVIDTLMTFCFSMEHKSYPLLGVYLSTPNYLLSNLPIYR